MSEQNKVAAAESVAKVFIEALMKNVKAETERRNAHSRKFEFAWSNRETKMNEGCSVEEFRMSYLEYTEEFK